MIIGVRRSAMLAIRSNVFESWTSSFDYYPDHCLLIPGKRLHLSFILSSIKSDKWALNNSQIKPLLWNQAWLVSVNFWEARFRKAQHCHSWEIGNEFSCKGKGGKRINLLSAICESVLMHGHFCLLSLYRTVRKESVQLYKSEHVSLIRFSFLFHYQKKKTS